MWETQQDTIDIGRNMCSMLRLVHRKFHSEISFEFNRLFKIHMAATRRLNPDEYPAWIENKIEWNKKSESTHA